jgi:hypothetical protein
MNLKQLSVLSLCYISSISLVYASETERKVLCLHKEFENAQQQRIAAVTIAQQLPEWTTFQKAQKRIPGYCNDDFKRFQYAAELFYATEEGKKVAYWHMKSLALYKMTNYVRARASETDRDSMLKGINAALYGEDLCVADTSDDIRETVNNELLALVDTVERENQ